jgi:hypothetical protein
MSRSIRSFTGKQKGWEKLREKGKEEGKLINPVRKSHRVLHRNAIQK